MSERTPLSSSVEDVMVFRRGAIVRRRVEVPEGIRKARIPSLPLSLVGSSLRVRAEGSAAHDAVVVLALGDDDEESLPARDEALVAAKLQERIAAGRVAAMKTVLADLKDISIKSRARTEGEPPVPIPAAERRKLIQFRREEIETREGELAALNEALRLATEERQACEEKRKQASNAIAARKNELRKAVDLSLDGNAGTLWIEYSVPTASWRPSYVLRLRDDLGHCALEGRAIVAQNTGEDWKDASLRLSTAIPQAHAELPTLRSLRIGRQQPAPQTRGYRPPPSGVDLLFQDYDQAFKEPPPPRQSEPEPTPTPVMKTLSRTLTGAVGGAPPPPAMAPAAPPEAAAPAPLGQAMQSPKLESMRRGRPKPASRAQKKKSLREDTQTFGGMADEQGPTGPLQPDKGWLEFGNLRMPAAFERGRGKLREVGLLEGFQSNHADLLAAVKSASLMDEPPGHALPRPLDGFDYSFEVVGKATVVSDGKWVALPLEDAEAESSPRFVCVPRESRDVFRFVDVPNPLNAPLLEGPLDIYVGGRFLLARSMPVVSPGERLRLGLGVEQRIKVARNVRFEENVAGMLRGSLELEHSLEVEVVSHIASDAILEVRERVPVLREEEDDIEVRVLESKPPWKPYQGEAEELRGGYRWEVPLKRGEKHVLHASYTIKISSKHELVGGNRRDA